MPRKKFDPSKDPVLKALLDRLRNDWESSSEHEKTTLLQAVTAQQCHVRAAAEYVGKTEGALRYYLPAAPIASLKGAGGIPCAGLAYPINLGARGTSLDRNRESISPQCSAADAASIERAFATSSTRLTARITACSLSPDEQIARVCELFNIFRAE